MVEQAVFSFWPVTRDELCSIQSTSSPVLGATDRVSEWELSSAYYYQLAAQYLKEKRSCLELTLSMSETATDIDSKAESVVPSVYVGPFARLLEQGDIYVMQPLTDEEDVHYALAEGKRFQDIFEITLLKRSFESYTNFNAQRMASYCGFEMAREYFAVNDYANAKEIVFYSIASTYRREGWVNLLWEVLGYLRECSNILRKMKDFVEYSLEMAALPVSSNASIQSLSFKECGPAGPASVAQREIIHTVVFELARGETGLASNEGNINFKVTGDQPLRLEIDLLSPLRVVLLASVAFHKQIVKPGVSSSITLSLLSQLPLSVDIGQLDIQFNQSACNFTVVNCPRPKSDEISNGLTGQRVETAPVLVLLTNKWPQITYDIKFEQSGKLNLSKKKSGKLECSSVIASLGPYFTICCMAKSPAALNDLPLWKFKDRVI